MRGSIVDSEVSDERDGVAVRIADGGQLHSLIHRRGRSAVRPLSETSAMSRSMSSTATFNSADPARSASQWTWTHPGVGHSPFDDLTFDWQVVGGAAE
jgi:hypothetical protein